MQPTDNSKIDDSNETVMDSIVPDGDIVLVIRTEQRRLLVFSTVFKKSSKVFAVLLGPRFLEGQVSASPQQPKEIALADDDPTAMSDMCHLLHSSQVKDLLGRPSADRILAFAVVVDKYDCVDTLQLQIQGLLLGQPILQKDLEFMERVKNLLASYVLKHSWSFKLLCESAALHSTQSFITLLEVEWAKPFPSNLICECHCQRRGLSWTN